MDHKSFEIAGPILISPKVIGDSRGFFCERFRVDQFKDLGITNTFIQDNYSRSSYGILRGLHYQWAQPQSKLVTCTRGVILDVAVDIRKDSPTYGKYVMAELNGDKPEWLWVPAGVAHGFLVLSKDGADVSYKVDNVWNGKGESGIRWNDPEIGVSWPIENPILSDKDRTAKTFAEYKADPKF
jgi:dTDP-4-dehydrorhamnose 3,5-epimerase